LSWINLSDQTTSVTAVFYPSSGASFLITKRLQPYRRAGLDANQLSSVADGLYSVVITSNHPIVAALTQYRFAPARGAGETGVLAGGAPRGALPGAIIPSGGQSTV